MISERPADGPTADSPPAAGPTADEPVAGLASADGRPAGLEVDGPAATEPVIAGDRPPPTAFGAAKRLATAAVRLATRPPCRASEPPCGARDPRTADSAAGPADTAGRFPVPAGAPVETADATLARVPGAAAVREGVAGRPRPVTGEAPGAGRVAGGCCDSARRIASVRRSAVTGPGAESGELGTARPPLRAGGDAELAGTAAESVADRRAAPARAADRRSAAATPAPLCWGTAPALAARAGVESPLPVEFPGGPTEEVEAGAVEVGEEIAGIAGRGARSLRCSCELLIGPAAVTSSIRRTGIGVDTRPPAMVPGERGWSSVGTCLAARAKPRAGRVTRAGAGAAAAESESESASACRGVHQRGGRTSA